MLLLGLLGRFLLTPLDIGLVLRGFLLLLLVTRGVVRPLLRLLRGLLVRLVELALEIRLLLVVRLLARRALRPFRAALRLLQCILLLLVAECSRVGRVVRRPLRRFRRVLGLLQRLLLVALLRRTARCSSLSASCSWRMLARSSRIWSRALPRQ